jgi:hypothetical protein
VSSLLKIQAGRINNVDATTWLAPQGQLFYDEDNGVLRVGDGVTPGGRYVYGPGGGGSGLIGGNLIPTINTATNALSTGTIGTAANPWKTIYLSSSTFYVGGLPITVNPNGTVLVNGIQVGTGYTGSSAPGYTGSQGIGYTGSFGYTGSSGAFAALGYSGSQGEQGPQGPAGGFTGSVGFVGSMGRGTAGVTRTYFFEGALVENISNKRFYIAVSSSLYLIRVNLNSAGQTQSTIAIKQNNSTINTITIPAGTTYISLSSSTYTLAANDYLTVDIIQPSNAVNLYVTFVYREL